LREAFSGYHSSYSEICANIQEAFARGSSSGISQDRIKIRVKEKEEGVAGRDHSRRFWNGGCGPPRNVQGRAVPLWQHVQQDPAEHSGLYGVAC